MPARELHERLPNVPLPQIHFQNSFEQPRHFRERNPFENLASYTRMFPRAPSKHDVVTFTRDAARCDLHTLQTDIAHIMLRAGMRTARKVNVDRLIELNAAFQMLRN